MQNMEQVPGQDEVRPITDDNFSSCWLRRYCIHAGRPWLHVSLLFFETKKGHNDRHHQLKHSQSA